jgi:hypothetical protein
VTNPAQPDPDQDDPIREHPVDRVDEQVPTERAADDERAEAAADDGDRPRVAGQIAATAANDQDRIVSAPATEPSTVDNRSVDNQNSPPAAVSGYQEPGRPSVGLAGMATALLVIAGGLAVAGSFGLLEEESEQSGNQSLTLSYTSWHLTQGGTYPSRIYFHAPHFGIPLVATGVLVVIGGLLLVLARAPLARLAGSLAAVAAGLLVGTVWTICMVVSADLDAVDRTTGFTLTWASGVGFTLVLAAGITGAVGGILALLATRSGHTPAVSPAHTPSPRPREPESA